MIAVVITLATLVVFLSLYIILYPGTPFQIFHFAKHFIEKPAGITTMVEAVTNRSVEDVNRLIQEGVNIDQPDERGETPLLIAVGSSQYEIAEVLIDNGANIFATSEIGYNVGLFPYYDTHSTSEGESGRFRLKVIEKLKAKGFPWPPPNTDRTLEMIKDGTWPKMK